MRLTDIDAPTIEQLNSACGGVFNVIQDHCEATGLEAHLSVQTHLEGLEYGQMKLYIQLLGGSGTDLEDYAVALLEGSAKVIGWNLYLHDTVGSARANLNRANSKIPAVTAETRVLH